MQTFSVLKTQDELHQWRQEQCTPIHFVPTMGGLHKGHSKLIETAQKTERERAPVVLVSVFVNPLQFSPTEDFNNYPRDLDKDCNLATASGASALWAPSVEDIFPNGPDSHIRVHAPKNLQANLCGVNRKGHFDGVATVMSRLLAIIKPNLVFLGEKDWQQLIIIRHLIKDLGLSIGINTIGTVRDQDGLAYSSRNSLLKAAEREKAILLPQLLKKAYSSSLQKEEVDISKINAELNNNGLRVEYLETVDPFTLQLVKPNKRPCLLATAIKCGETRLIDHTFLIARKPIIAIDGPAGAGKSSVTKAVASKLSLLYLDTGAMYRAVTWLIKKNNISHKDESSIRLIVKDLKIEFQTSQSNDQQVMVNNYNITEEIRSPEITNLVSQIASIGAVREALTAQQRNMGKLGGLIAEGRDIGSSVFPDADVKFYLTASPKERAKRRALDLNNRGFSVLNIQQLEKEILERDMLDSNRKISPLKKAKDSIEVITDGMDIDQVINLLIKLFYTRVPKEVWPKD